MIRNSLTPSQKRRFDHNNICPICANLIDDFDNFEFIIKRRRRCQQYIFYHFDCLEKEGMIYEEESSTKEK